MIRILFLLSIPVFLVGGLIAPLVWVYTVNNWKGLLMTVALISLWATKAILEHK